ncbi:Ig-like domain-containing protein [Sphingobacterium multivorum]|uniref:Ig-like domain-containing protein n=1 Tax=Sphingobacterium multivorum TaxID=28454 RepID=UPI0028A7556D|nr:Ig-like domain-containing protein [Sphingobacterium multivorum]
MQYKYFLTGRSGTRQVFPVNDGSLDKTFDKKSNRADFTRTMKGSIVLIGEDFKWLYEQELLVYRFDPLDIEIQKYCNGGWNNEWFKGQISLNSGEWDLDNCRVELTIDNSDKYACYEVGKDTTLNILNSVYPKVNLVTAEGRIETESFSSNRGGGVWDPFPGEDNPRSKGWVVIREYVIYYNNGINGTQQFTGIEEDEHHEITWAREVVIDSPVDLTKEGWVSLGFGKYVRSPIVYDTKYEYTDRSYLLTCKVLDRPIDNGMLLKDIFDQFLLTMCPGMTLTSDFFQWNPENTSNINYVTGLPSRISNLLVFQKSDVKRPFVDNATIAELKFSELLEDVCNIFQLEWEITDDNKFKIEHVSYKTRHRGLDTTIGQNAVLNKGNRRYKYDFEAIPRIETFSFMDDTSYGDFKSTPIVYTNPIAGKEKDEEKYAIKNFSTDLQQCLENPDPDSKVVSKEGFVLVACSPGMSPFRESSIRGGNTINNPLAWSQLHRDYWRHNRYMLNFKMNERDTLALSVRPIKIQEKVKYQLCCGSDFDTDGLIKTALGEDGVLESATFNLFKEVIELKIAFPAEGKLESNIPPQAVDDIADTFQNTPVVIDVLENDIDTDGIIIPSSLNITSVYPGTAIVTDDFKVKYTPETGFIGDGFVWYNVKDNLGEISNNARVTITVKQGSSLPVANGNSFILAQNRQLRPGAGSIQKNDTASTVITVVPENKATAQAGTVVIESNGNFTYTPAVDFVGEDTFSYKIRDNYLNEATGTITINVFQSKTIYVSFHQIDNRDDFTRNCDNGMQSIGRETLSDFTLKLWADSSRTIPLDAEGYNLKIRMKQVFTDYYDSSRNYDFVFNIDFNEGSVYELYTDFTTQLNYSGCYSYERENWKIEISIESDPSYIII